MQRLCRNIEDLPPEVAQHSLSLVLPKDLCSLMLTSSRMRTLSSYPKLWSQMNVNKQKIQQEGLTRLFSINRFSKIRKLELSNMEFSKVELETNLNAITLSSVEELNLSVNLSEAAPELLAQSIKNLRKVSLRHCHLTPEQCKAVLESWSAGSALVELEMRQDIREVASELLGKVTSNLKKVNFDLCEMSTEQCIIVFETCIDSSKLADLSLRDVTLNGVPSELLGRAASHLKRLSLGYVMNDSVTTEKCIAVLGACNATSTLVDLSMECVNFGEVSTDLLRNAVRYLRALNLDYCNLSTEQLLAVFEACIAVPTLVDLSVVALDLTEVPGDLFVGAAGHLRKLILDLCNLTFEQETLIDNSFDLSTVKISNMSLL